jgi:uncharacterized membrane protein YfcA
VHFSLVFITALLAGAINAIAGGGTLITFPTLIWLGVPSIVANATNTIAILPGSVASAWTYRRDLASADTRLYTLIVPALAGGILGAMLLYRTPTDVFDRLIPLLILFATILFMLQEPLQRRFNLQHTHRSWALVYQFLVGIYGGYFGAGYGILTLAALSLMGYTHIHQMNGIKSLLAVGSNGIAAIYFVYAGLVFWPDALVMAVGAIIGGVAGAVSARRMSHRAVRRIVVAIGFVMTLSLILRLL